MAAAAGDTAGQEVQLGLVIAACTVLILLLLLPLLLLFLLLRAAEYGSLPRSSIHIAQRVRLPGVLLAMRPQHSIEPGVDAAEVVLH